MSHAASAKSKRFYIRVRINLPSPNSNRSELLKCLVSEQTTVGQLIAAAVSQLNHFSDFSNHALWCPLRRKWLLCMNWPLQNYDLCSEHDLIFMSKRRLLKLRLPDSRIVEIEVDFSERCFWVIKNICQAIGITTPDSTMLGFQRTCGAMNNQLPSDLASHQCISVASSFKDRKDCRFATSELNHFNKSQSIKDTQRSKSGASMNNNNDKSTMTLHRNLSWRTLSALTRSSATVMRRRKTLPKQPTLSSYDHGCVQYSLGWLDSNKTLLEQGIESGDVIVNLRFKYFSSDILPSDKFSLFMLYCQCKNDILNQSITSRNPSMKSEMSKLQERIECLIGFCTRDIIGSKEQSLIGNRGRYMKSQTLMKIRSHRFPDNASRKLGFQHSIASLDMRLGQLALYSSDDPGSQLQGQPPTYVFHVLHDIDLLMNDADMKERRITLQYITGEIHLQFHNRQELLCWTNALAAMKSTVASILSNGITDRQHTTNGLVNGREQQRKELCSNHRYPPAPTKEKSSLICFLIRYICKYLLDLHGNAGGKCMFLVRIICPGRDQSASRPNISEQTIAMGMSCKNTEEMPNAIVSVDRAGISLRTLHGSHLWTYSFVRLCDWEVSHESQSITFRWDDSCSYKLCLCCSSALCQDIVDAKMALFREAIGGWVFHVWSLVASTDVDNRNNDDMFLRLTA